jgi:hypothetical protein
MQIGPLYQYGILEHQVENLLHTTSSYLWDAIHWWKRKWRRQHLKVEDLEHWVAWWVERLTAAAWAVGEEGAERAEGDFRERIGLQI